MPFFFNVGVFRPEFEPDLPESVGVIVLVLGPDVGASPDSHGSGIIAPSYAFNISMELKMEKGQGVVARTGMLWIGSHACWFDTNKRGVQ